MNRFDSRYLHLQIKHLDAIITKEKTVVQIAKEMQVSRQTIHKWLHRYKRFEDNGLLRKRRIGHSSAHHRTSYEVERLVVQCAHQHWNDGVQTLHDWLLYEYNLSLHPSTIWRILKRNKVRYTDEHPKTRKRWKKLLYAHKQAGKELQMDTKYPFGYKQGKVIYTIIDDATRWVYAYCYPKANQYNTLDFLNRVRSCVPFPIQKIRTDQGKEFIAKAVKHYLASNHIEYRNNTPYCPEENGKIERFHRTLNDKFLPFGITPALTLDELQYQLTLFLHYYNFRKKHRGLGMEGVTPIQKLTELASVNLTVRCYSN